MSVSENVKDWQPLFLAQWNWVFQLLFVVQIRIVTYKSFTLRTWMFEVCWSFSCEIVYIRTTCIICNDYFRFISSHHKFYFRQSVRSVFLVPLRCPLDPTPSLFVFPIRYQPSRWLLKNPRICSDFSFMDLYGIFLKCQQQCKGLMCLCYTRYTSTWLL